MRMSTTHVLKMGPNQMAFTQKNSLKQGGRQTPHPPSSVSVAPGLTGPSPFVELPLPGLLEGENPSRFSVHQANNVRDAVKRLLRWKKDGFPGGQPVSLSMQNVTELFRNAYVACEKTDGVRFLLLGTNHRVFLIGRRNEVREIEDIYLPRTVDLTESQDMTLLDGELVMDKRNHGGFIWRYLIYDCISVDGDEDIQKLNLLRRLQAAKKFVTEPLARLREVQQRQAVGADEHGYQEVHSGMDITDGMSGFELAEGTPRDPPMEIYLKDFFEIFDLETIRRLALRLPHPSDGIIFTPVKLPYATGTCPLLLKWKPPHLNTVDFSVEPVYDLDGVPQIFILCASYRVSIRNYPPHVPPMVFSMRSGDEPQPVNIEQQMISWCRELWVPDAAWGSCPSVLQELEFEPA